MAVIKVMQPVFRLTFLTFVLLLANLTNGLYEDQVGKFDWRQQYVGRAKFLHWDESAASGKRIIVATEQNVLASVSTKDGNIAWRHILESDQRGEIDDLAQHGSDVVIVTGGGKFVRCFNPTHGDLIWEANANPVNMAYKAQVRIIGSSHEDVAVLTSSSLNVFDIATGNLKWTQNLPNSETVIYSLLSVMGSNMYVVGVAAGSHVSVVQLTNEGTQVSTSSIPSAWINPDTSCEIIGQTQLVCIDTRSGTLQVASLGASKPTFKATLLQSLDLSGNAMTLLRLSIDSPQFALRLDTHIALLDIDDNTVKLIRDLPKVSAVKMVRYNDNPTVITLTRLDGHNAELTGYDAASGAARPELTLPITLPEHHGTPDQLNVMLLRKKDGAVGLRTVVSSHDHSLIFFQQSGRIMWTREEALSSILSVELVDLPVSQIQAKMEEEFGTDADDIAAMFVKRFRSQFAQLTEFIMQLKHKLRTPRHQHHLVDEDGMEEEEEDDEEDLMADTDYLTRDDFNIHKMIVVSTAAGKLFGMDSDTGYIIWRHHLPQVRPFDKYGEQIMPLFIQRTTAHFPLLPQAVVVGKHAVTGKGVIMAFNPISGVQIENIPAEGLVLNYKILQASLLAFTDDHFMRPLVLLTTNLQYDVYPAECRHLVETLAGKQFFFTTHIDEGVLRGYNLKKDGPQLVGQELWTVNLQKDTQTITNVVGKSSAHVHSQGIVLGDRSVLYKYLNPNLVVVTTQGEYLDTSQKTMAFISIYLIDTVSGSIVFHCTHNRAHGPVHVVHSENWIVYDYWSEKHRRTEIAVLDLYEGSKQTNATVFSSLNQPPLPLVMRQSYLFHGYLSAMTETITEKGITSKHLLMALTSGGILELPKSLVDARRPLELTPEHREEGLMPYIPELPRMYEAFINYNMSVYNIRGFHTAPSGLESTSLVLAYGLDLFYTRVTPSKMFDVLKEDFDYLFISSVLAGMIAVSVISQKLAAKKALKRAWR